MVLQQPDHSPRELRTPRLLLRPWRRGDEEPLLRHANNPNIVRLLRDRFPSPYTRRHANQWISMMEARQGVPTDFAIVDGDEPVGGIGIDVLADEARIGGELGYWVAEARWGRGYAREAVTAIVPYAFDVLALHRVQASVYAPNAASIRVLEQTGFLYEGRLRQAALKHGQLLDVLVYARLRTDAPAAALA
jgi:ribosomal-protein-alanine N-acetyltransferase